MPWSMSLGRIAGVRIYVHVTFFILLAWIALSFGQTSGWRGAFDGLTLFACLAFIIVLHELGHALAARRFGIRTRDITLLPIGGVARLERMPDEPLQELVVALAGPLVNVVLAAGIFAGVLVGRGVIGWSGAWRPEGSLVVQLFWINVSLAVFNMLPAFPMDGGRVLRAVLAMSMDYVRATRVAASIGQAMAVLFAVAGLLFNPMLILIALFVWVGAEAEAGMVRTKAVLSGVPVARLMATQFQTLQSMDPIGRVAEFAVHSFQHDFPVVSNGVPVGMLAKRELLKALAAHRPEIPVSEVMQPNIPALHPRDTVETALERFQSCKCLALPVVDVSGLIGILTAENIAEYLMVHDRLAQSAPPANAKLLPGSPHPRRTDLAEETTAV